MTDFASRLVRWQRAHGRHDLPWQESRDPYPVWLSEIMLQQTQVSSVIPYFRRFVARFPDLPALAQAPLDEVLAHWSGLGYYSRARNLHRAAQLVVERHRGVFPREFDQILDLPGIGRSTAAAVSAFAFGARCAILDGNVKRVMARFFAVEGHPGDQKVERELWVRAEQLLPDSDIAAYTQGLMDLGATVCTRARPKCAQCPMRGECAAYRQGRQAELPQSRRRKPLPEKETTMLVLLHRGLVFLEKRPAVGVWAGLWSFPELEPGEDAIKACLARYGLAVAAQHSLPAMRHTFTHFRLQIQPLRLEVGDVGSCAGEPGKMWLDVENALAAAIPAPIRTLLLGCREG